MSETESGWIDAELEAEFPGLALSYITRTAALGRSPDVVRERLAQLSSRFSGVHAITMRQKPIPSAYRIFFRQIGLDPDTHRTPVEAAALERLMAGGFVSRNLLDDALLIALIETGVPIWALDAAAVDGPLGIRGARAGETLGSGAYSSALEVGSLVVADARSPLAVLFGELAAGAGVEMDAERLKLFAVGVGGVPSIYVEEALWLCDSVLAAR